MNLRSAEDLETVGLSASKEGEALSASAACRRRTDHHLKLYSASG